MERPKEIALDELLMKTFWKLSDELNGYSVNSFKDLVHDLVHRLHWSHSHGHGPCICT